MAYGPNEAWLGGRVASSWRPAPRWI